MQNLRLLFVNLDVLIVVFVKPKNVLKIERTTLSKCKLVIMFRQVSDSVWVRLKAMVTENGN